MNKLIQATMLASIATVSVAATPAMAQNHYGYDDGYYRQAQTYRPGDTYRGDQYRGYENDGRRYDSRYDSRNDPRYNDGRYYQSCRRSSGTTGTILGAIAGGLLGREVGRGGYRNQPSTTGLILGAGAGALAGRAIDKNGNCSNRR